MSTTIDKKVVEMQFDNRQFESNVATTMSSIDKLKQSLNFKGTSKGLEDLNGAVKKVDMNPLIGAVETVGLKFNAMYSIANRALENLTDSAVNAGKRLVKSLSMDQVTAGMSKYEQKNASVQTIMNATGKSIDEVNKYLDKLMWFSDETSYGFTDMATSLSTMISTGGDIEKLVPLITGVANATAYAGKGAAEFGQIMQFAVNQAYSAGYMQLTDWKTFQSRSVNSKQLQETFISVAEEMGKIEKGSVTLNNFSTSLKDKWLDTEVMEAAFGVFGEFTEKVYQLSEDIESGNLSGYSEEIQKLAAEGKLETTAQMMEVLGKEFEGISKKAFEAGQEAKSFTEAIDATKDAVSSGWMKTFELIFGNYVQAKEIWSELCDALWDIFASGGEARNNTLQEALAMNPITQFAEKVQNITKTIEAPIKKLQEYEEIVNRIIRGDYGNGQARWDKLTEEGYDWAHAQNLVNEKLGVSLRRTTDYTEATEELTEQVVELTDAKLKELNFTEEEIQMYRDLEAESKKTGKSINELIEDMNQVDGRTLLVNSFRNIGSAVIGVIHAIRDAFSEIFPPMTALQLYNLIKRFSEFTEKLRLTDAAEGKLNETGQKLKRTFQGIFAIFDVILTVIGGPVKLVVKVLAEVLGHLGLKFLDITANIGDALVRFRDWVDSVYEFSKVIDWLKKGVAKLTPIFKKVSKWTGTAFKSMATQVSDAVKELKPVETALDAITKVLKKVYDWVSSIFSKISTKSIEDIGSSLKDMFASFKNSDKVSKVFETIADIGGKVWEILKAIGTGIKNCVTEFMSLEVVQTTISKIGTGLKFIFDKVSSGIKSIDLSKFVTNINDAFSRLANWIAELKDSDNIGKDILAGLVNGFTDGIKGLVDIVKKIANIIITTTKEVLGIESPSKVFITIGKFIMAGLIAGLLTSEHSLTDVVNNIVSSMSNGFEGMTFGEALISIVKTSLSEVVAFIKGIDMGSVIAVAISAGVFTIANKLLGVFVEFNKTLQMFGAATKGFGDMCSGAGQMMKDAGTLMKDVGAKLNPKKTKLQIIADSVLKFAGAIAVLAAAIYVLAKIPPGELWNAVGAVVALSVVITVCALAANKFAVASKNFNTKGFGKFSVGLIGIAASMLILAMAIKKLSFLNEDNMWPILTAMAVMIGGISLILYTLGKFVKGEAAKNINNAGYTIAKLSLVMLSLVFVIKQVSKLEPGPLIKGGITIAAFGVLVTGLIAATRLAGKHIHKVGGTILQLSAAMLLLVFVIKLVSKLSPENLFKGIVAITMFGGLIVGLIAATKLASKGELAKVGATIMGMAAAMAILAITVKMVAKIDPNDMNKGLGAIIIFGGIIVGLTAATKLAGGGGLKNVGQTLVAMAIAIGVIAGVAIVLGLIPLENLAKGVAAVSIICAMVALMVRSLNGAVDVNKSLTAMTIMIGLLIGSVIALSFVPTADLIKATLSVTLITAALSLLIKSLQYIQTGQKTFVRTLVTLGVITLVIAALGGILTGMSLLAKPDSLIPIATALSILMLALAATFKIIDSSKTMSVEKLTRSTLMLAALSGVVVILGGVLTGMSFLPNPNSLIPIATGISILLASLTAVFAAVSIIGKFVKADSMTNGILGLSMMVVPLILFAAVLSEIKPIDPAVNTTINTIIGVMAAMSVLLLLLSGIGAIITATAGGALLGIVGLVIMLGAFNDFYNSLAQLTAIPNVESLKPTIDTIVSVMGSMTKLLAQLAVIGLLGVAGIAGVIGLTAMIVPLTVFSKALVKMEPIPEDVVPSINILLEVLDAITSILIKVSILGPLTLIGVASITALSGVLVAFGALVTTIGWLMSKSDSLESFLDKGLDIMIKLASGIGTMIGEFIGSIATGVLSKLPQMGTYLSDFMEEISGFVEGAKQIDAEAMEGVKNLAEAIIMLTAADVISGLAQFFTGSTPIAEFGNSIAVLGEGLHSFASSVDGVPIDQVGPAAEAVKHLAEAAQAIPKEGGWAGAIFGENGFASFAEGLSSIGFHLKMFLANIGEFGKSQLDVVDYSSQAIVKMAEAASKIPNEGGCWAWLCGDNSLAEFGYALPGLGANLANFIANIGTFGQDQLNVVDYASQAITKLAEAADSIPNEDGFWASLCGDNSLADFSAMLPELGTNLKAFTINATGVNSKKAEEITSMVVALTELAEFGIENVGISLERFGDNIVAFAKNAVTFTNKLSKLDDEKIRAALGNFNRVLSITALFSSSDIESILALGEALKQAGVDAVNAFIEAFTTDDAAAKAVEAVDEFIETTATKVKTEKNKKKFNKIGEYLVDGLVEGINDNSYKAAESVENMATSLPTVMSEFLKINSPSKVFSTIGGSVVEGLVKGIDDNTGDATDSAVGLGNALLTATQRSLKINSPSIVFKKEVGRYIVQGVAEGITSDMSAEEAAAQKAQNIVDAFQKYLDLHDINAEIAEKELQIWTLKSGDKATDEERNAKELEYLNSALSSKLSKQTLAYAEWQETVKHLGESSKEAKEALSKYLDAQNEVLTIEGRIADMENTKLEQQNRDIERGMEVRAKNQELWDAQNEQTATRAEKDTRHIRDLNDDITSLTKQLEIANEQHSKAIEKYAADSEEVFDAWTKVQDIQIDIAEKKNEIAEIEKEALERDRELLKEKQDLISDQASLDYEIWYMQKGKKSSDAEKYAAKADELEAQLKAEQKVMDVLFAEYQTLLSEAKDEEGRNKANVKYNEYRQQLLETLKLENSIKNLEIEALNAEQERYSLSSEMADLEYQIWEKTTGRKATASEKNVKKLSVLSQQLRYQSEILKITYEEYDAIVDEYGSRSIEAQSKYKEYMQQQLEIANLQNEVEDIQKATVERQKLAKSDYEDYIKTYEKFYLANGMTREELEKDAKLVTGYDPSSTVNEMVNKTNKELNNLLSNDAYTSALNGFTSMGKSYVSSVNKGVKDNSQSFTDTMSGTANACITFLEGTEETWAELGKMFMEALSEGLKNGSSLVLNVIAGVGDSAIESLKSSVESIADAVNSSIDTEPTIKPVLDLSEVESGSAKLATTITRSMALKIRDSVNENNVNSQNGNSNSSTGATYNFTQNNYSPKALSSTDIYRQTNTQLATTIKRIRTTP